MTSTIDDVVVGADHVRERVLAGGPGAAETADLLAVLLGSGTVGRPPEELARDLLGFAGGLRPLAGRTPAELASLQGLDDARVARIVASLELGRRLLSEPLPRGAFIRDASDVFRHYHASMRDLRFEQFRAVLLDGKHRVIREELLSQGTLTSSPVHPREVFSPAIRHSAAALFLVHNHPSGDPSPSSDDIAITNRLAEVGRVVGIRVVDHIVIGDGAFTSLASRGLIHHSDGG